MASEFVAVVQKIHAPIALEGMRVAQHVRVPPPRSQLERRILVVASPVLQVIRDRVPDTIAPCTVLAKVERLTVTEEHVKPSADLDHGRKRLTLIGAEPV